MHVVNASSSRQAQDIFKVILYIYIYIQSLVRPRCKKEKRKLCETDALPTELRRHLDISVHR